MNFKNNVDNSSIRLLIKEYLKERNGCLEGKSEVQEECITFRSNITYTGISEINSV